MLKREILKPEVKNKLRQYGIEECDYRLKLQTYNSEERKGVPYLALVIKKDLPDLAQFDLELELKNIDNTLCVLFKDPAHGRLLHLK